MAEDLPQAEKILLYSNKKVRANLTSRSGAVVTVHPFWLAERREVAGPGDRFRFGNSGVHILISFINLSAGFFIIII